MAELQVRRPSFTNATMKASNGTERIDGYVLQFADGRRRWFDGISRQSAKTIWDKYLPGHVDWMRQFTTINGQRIILA